MTCDANSWTPFFVRFYSSLKSVLDRHESRAKDEDTCAVARHLDILTRLRALPPTPQELHASFEKIDLLVHGPEPWSRFLARRRVAFLEYITQGHEARCYLAGDTWEQIRSDPLLSRAFDVNMIMRTTKEPVLAGSHPKVPFSFVDVGGSAGQYSIKLLQEEPFAERGIVVDNYDGVGWWARRQGDTRIGVVRTDILQTPLPPAPLYLVSSVLHNLTDQCAIRVLKNCHASGVGSPAIVIVERAFDPTNDRDSGRDLDMYALFGGKERSVAALRDLITAAGLRALWSRRTHDNYTITMVDAQ